MTKQFGTVNVIKGVDLKIDDGEFVVFVGPSGSGKSTLLRMIAGLEDTTSGNVEIGDKDVTHLDSAERGIAKVFQSYALYPHMKVRDNMGFGLKMNGFPKTEIESRIKKAADILELSPLLDRKPGQLSGGQRQRVAIGRAIVREPQAFLFDEPLSNLDAELRVAMRVEIAKLHHELKTTMVYVTHDQTEAMTLADKIVVLRDGKIEQVGAPLKLYDDPDNLFIAGFIGSPSMNILNAKVMSSTSTHAQVALPDFNNANITIPVTSQPAAGENYKLGVRPEHFTDSGDCNIKIKVDVAEHLGGTSYLYSSSNSEKSVVVENRTGRNIKIGSDVDVGILAKDTYLFDENQQRIR